MAHGDHHVLYRAAGQLIGGATVDDLRANLERQGTPFLLVPHHIGYPQGVRGTNWDTYRPERSPIVELYSLHGCSESDEAPYPMLHTMGPRDSRSTALAGLERGHRFGFVASTDQHSGYRRDGGSRGPLGLLAAPKLARPAQLQDGQHVGQRLRLGRPDSPAVLAGVDAHRAAFRIHSRRL